MTRESNDTLAAMQNKILADKGLADDRFKMFFIGLIFAIISYLGANASSEGDVYLKIFLIISMLLLLLSGLILLIQLDGVIYRFGENDNHSKWFVCLINFYHLKICSSKSYWFSFVLGMFFLTLYFCVKV